MKHILTLAFAHDGENFDKTFLFQGENVRITQFSTNFNLELTLELIKKYDGMVDAMAISGLPPQLKYKGGVFLHPEAQRIRTASKETPILDGQILREVYLPHGIRQFYLKNNELLYKKRVGFYSGALLKPAIEVFEEFENRIQLADPYFYFHLPMTLASRNRLDSFIKFGTPVFRKMHIKRTQVANFKKDPSLKYSGFSDFFNSDVFVGNLSTLNLIDLEHLKGKTLLVDFLTPEFKVKLQEVGVNTVISCLPHNSMGDFINFPVFEALLQVFTPGFERLDQDTVLSWMDKLSLMPKAFKLNEIDDDSLTRFAFIIHPLSKKHLFYHPLLKNLDVIRKPFESMAEDVLSLSPGFFYGKIKGVQSEGNGKKIEGLIYTVTETPKKLMEKDPDQVYKKLIRLCNQASDHGAKVIGLGAYTKIVGDAGVTVAKNSPIPVTTGNSLSAAATLWAAKYAIDKIGMVKKNESRYQGTYMVVGASGSIGAVSAKILAQAWDKIVLVAPRAHKLLQLKEEISLIDREVEIEVATSPEKYLSSSDLIITTTSAQGKRILDIEKVRPGCVICDVSRPFDIREEDALKRPDVLVIASGEVELPGMEVDVGVNLGLQGTMVYACLAETALLAMAGRFESFTLSRNINYQKVIEIDQMAKKHGVRLSCIMGHHGAITDEEMALCREHALKKGIDNDLL